MGAGALVGSEVAAGALVGSAAAAGGLVGGTAVGVAAGVQAPSSMLAMSRTARMAKTRFMRLSFQQDVRSVPEAGAFWTSAADGPSRRSSRAPSAAASPPCQASGETRGQARHVDSPYCTKRLLRKYPPSVVSAQPAVTGLTHAFAGHCRSVHRRVRKGKRRSRRQGEHLIAVTSSPRLRVRPVARTRLLLVHLTPAPLPPGEGSPVGQPLPSRGGGQGGEVNPRPGRAHSRAPLQ